MDNKCKNDSSLKIVYQQYQMCMACDLRGNCGDKIVPGLFMVPNCHYYHCKLNFNNCFALSHSPNRVAKKDLVVEWLWLQQSFPKRIGEIVNSCRNSHILKGEMFMHSLKVSIFSISHDIEFKTPFSKASGIFRIFFEIPYKIYNMLAKTMWKLFRLKFRIDRIYDWLKVVPFYLDYPI